MRFSTESGHKWEQKTSAIRTYETGAGCPWRMCRPVESWQTRTGHSRLTEWKVNDVTIVLFFISAAKNTLFAVPMELKSGGVDASEVSAQLQRGAEFAERFAPSAFRSICHPVLFHGKSIHPKQRKTLNRTKVRFRGRQLTIKTARCNQPRNLARALGDDVLKVL